MKMATWINSGWPSFSGYFLTRTRQPLVLGKLFIKGNPNDVVGEVAEYFNADAKDDFQHIFLRVAGGKKLLHCLIRNKALVADNLTSELIERFQLAVINGLIVPYRIDDSR